ncbi:MAG: hypothetical protein ACKOET_08455 [Verrucomicrobiota bacterium]
MAQNRKRDEAALRLGTLVRALVACVVISGLGIGYVRQTVAHKELGEQIRRLEQERDETRRVIERQRIQLTALSSPENLRFRLQKFGLPLTNVAPTRRIVVEVPPLSGPLERREAVLSAGTWGVLRAPAALASVGDGRR